MMNGGADARFLPSSFGRGDVNGLRACDRAVGCLFNVGAITTAVAEDTEYRKKHEGADCSQDDGPYIEAFSVLIAEKTAGEEAAAESSGDTDDHTRQEVVISLGNVVDNPACEDSHYDPGDDTHFSRSQSVGLPRIST